MAVPGEPLDMSLRGPKQERLRQLAEELGSSWEQLSFEERCRVYALATGEMQTSALSVLAQFCAGAR